jgi:hypothetical protein
MSFIEKAKPCKIGTVPMVVQSHGSDKMIVGGYVRVKYMAGGDWHKVLITRVDPNGYFCADR